MRYYFAPLESVTTALYRALHQAHFGGVDRYYMPFVSPTQQHKFTPRQLRDIAPEHNTGVHAVPQILCKDADDFIWSVQELCDMGYTEVNLNLGCPSQTVTAKGKGSGFLASPDALDAFLAQSYNAFAQMPVPMQISVKTRLGKHDAAEFTRILDIYNQYPISELTIHPRVQKDYYLGPVRMESFLWAQAHSKIPLCYNGDIVAPQDMRALHAVDAVMIGRGLLADPALLRKLRGGKGASKDELRAFLTALFNEYTALYGSANNALIRMRDVWFYQVHLFADNDEFVQKFRRMKTVTEYKILVNRIFNECDLLPDAVAGWSKGR